MQERNLRKRPQRGENPQTSTNFNQSLPSHQPHDVQAGMIGLLLTGIGDLRDGWHLPFSGLPDASVVAVAYREDGAISPNAATLGGLHRDLQVLVEVDPAASTRALVGQGVLGHEIV